MVMLRDILLRFHIISTIFIFPISVEMDWLYGATNSRHRSTLHGCNSLLRIEPHFNLDTFFSKSERNKLQVKAILDDIKTEKGCGRTSYNSASLYSKCGINRIIPLLPVRSYDHQSYTKYLAQKVLSKGDIDYIFDGGTAVRFPTKKLPVSWYEKYTITGWVFIEEHIQRQYIFSWSDGNTSRHDQTGFYITRHPDANHVVFGFHHTHYDALTGGECLIKQKWKIHENVQQWSFFALSFAKCEAQLSVNGHEIVPIMGGLKLHMPDKHIQPKFVVGARWTGSIHKYDDYMHGRLSGFILKAHENINNDKLKCLLECKEKLKLATELPGGFQKEENEEGLTIDGAGTRTDFQNVIHDIIYVNIEEFPVQEERKVTFEVTNLVAKQTLVEQINVEIIRKPVSISIQGNCAGKKDNVMTKQGSRLCTDSKIIMSGCIQTLDYLEVRADSILQPSERLYIPSAYLKRHQLNLYPVETGFVVLGNASVSQYTELLHHIKYSHIGIFVADVTRTITINTSSRNGLIKSNTMEITFTVSEHGLVVRPTEKVVKPIDNTVVYFIDTSSTDQSLDQPPGKVLPMKTNHSSHPNHHYAIWLVVACAFSSLFVLLMVSYGYKRYRSRDHRDYETYIEEKHASSSPDYFWDEEGLPVRLTINPSERISITNDPYSEILLKQQSCEETVTTDGSVYSDDEETNFDNDSIRQLEWDCLENSLDSILNEEINEKKMKRKYDQGSIEAFL